MWPFLSIVTERGPCAVFPSDVHGAFLCFRLSAASQSLTPTSPGLQNFSRQSHLVKYWLISSVSGFIAKGTCEVLL